MKPVCEALGLARSNVHLLKARLSSWADGRSRRTPFGDEQLLADIRAQITELPSYGYRRACALVNRQRANVGTPRVNAKRVYRVMANNGFNSSSRRNVAYSVYRSSRQVLKRKNIRTISETVVARPHVRRCNADDARQMRQTLIETALALFSDFLRVGSTLCPCAPYRLGLESRR